MNFLLIWALLAQSIPFPGPGTVHSVGFTPWVTTATGGSGATGVAGSVGEKITIGGSNVTVAQLGRYCVAGNAQTHTTYILDASGASVASGTVNMSGCTGGTYVYGTVSYTMLASTVYYVMVTETTSPGTPDTFISGQTFTSTAAATSTGSGRACYALTPPPVVPTCAGAPDYGAAFTY